MIYRARCNETVCRCVVGQTDSRICFAAEDMGVAPPCVIGHVGNGVLHGHQIGRSSSCCDDQNHVTEMGKRVKKEMTGWKK